MDTTATTQAAARRGLGFLVLAALLWGTVGIATKALYQLTDTNPLSVGFFRLALSVPALLAALRLSGGWPTARISRGDLGLMLLIGAMMALYQVCYFAAIAQVGVTTAVLVTLCVAPVLVALLSSGLLRERLGRRVLLALLCALGGTLLLVGVPGAAAQQQNTLLGVGLALGSALGYAVMAICSRQLAVRHHPLTSITIGFSTGALLLLPFALMSRLVVSYPAVGWLLLLHLGLVPTALAYVLFLLAMRHTSATVASVVTLLEPLTSTLLAWALFGEQLGPLGLPGALLLLGAIGLLYQARGQEPEAGSR